MHQAPEPIGAGLGAVSGAAVAILCAAYLVCLAIGLLTLPSPEHPIQQPWFAAMEILILAIAPAMVMLAASLHAWSPSERKPLVLAGVVFFGMCAALTFALHFTILTLSRHPAFSAAPWASLVFAFRWPSLAYALDILAWDVFFPLGALCLAGALQGPGPAGTARTLLMLSAALAFAGLLGVPLADMLLRNVGILGYAVLFPVGAAFLALMFQRARRAHAS
jgi:hypothetical protein